MNNFTLPRWLAGFVLASLTFIEGLGQPAAPVLRTAMTTNTAPVAPAANDVVPTWDAGNARWQFSLPPGVGGGEIATMDNDGAGVYLSAPKVGTVFHINSITNKDGYIGITSNANLLTLSFDQKSLYQVTNGTATPTNISTQPGAAMQQYGVGGTTNSFYISGTNGNIYFEKDIYAPSTVSALTMLGVDANRKVISAVIGQGLTNSAGTLNTALFPGTNVTFTTNYAGSLTIAAMDQDGTIHSIGKDLLVDQMLVRIDGTSGTNVESSTIYSADDGSLSGISNLTATNTITASNFVATASGSSTMDSLLVTNTATAGVLQVGTATGPTIRTGTGSPEGVVAAPVGSLYLNVSGGTSTTLYVKTSGAGTSSGWTAK